MTSKKLISLVTNDLSGDQRVHKTISSLMKAGWTPVLVGRAFKDSQSLDRNYECKRFRLLFNHGPLFYANYNIRIFFYLLFARADLLIANDLDTLPAVYAVAKLKGLSYVFDSHEYFTEVPELINRPLVKRIWKFFEKLIVPRTPYMLTVNQDIANLFETEYSVRPKVLMNLPNKGNALKKIPDFSLPKSFDSLKILIYQGAVNVGRGLELMIEAVSQLPEFGLLIVGDGDILDRLKDLVNQQGLNDSVVFTGRIPMEYLPSITALGTLGLSLEQDLGLNYRLALPNKLFDYMQAGIPVIVSDLPLMSAIVQSEEVGLVCQSHDVQSLKDVILEITSDPDSYKKYSNASKKAAEKYSWEGQEKVVIDLCDRALKRV